MKKYRLSITQTFSIPCDASIEVESNLSESELVEYVNDLLEKLETKKAIFNRIKVADLSEEVVKSLEIKGYIANSLDVEGFEEDSAVPMNIINISSAEEIEE
jgi:hypothetical protein